MQVSCTLIPFEITNRFSKIVTDYIEGNPALSPFYLHPTSLEGIANAMVNRAAFNTNRIAIVDYFTRVYKSIQPSEAQANNIKLLAESNCFTITTAHQPNIFTGPLYFIYKIAHTIQLATHLTQTMPGNNFVPVYYMGSEDADLDELGHFYIDAEKYTWQTKQTGAVGRMHTKGVEKIIQQLEGQFINLPFGKDLLELVKKAYLSHNTIQEATFYLVNKLFEDYGLLVLQPDDAELKRAFEPIIKQELLTGFSQKAVSPILNKLEQAGYKAQASGRPINLFYLSDQGARARIELRDGKYIVDGLNLEFTQAEILKLVETNPELFSGNVILRGLFQETILPNIVFIGGGGELAYWMELKALFEISNVPYPVLLLRNSFSLIKPRFQHIISKLGLTLEELFLPNNTVEDILVAKKEGISIANTQLAIEALNTVYMQVQKDAATVDQTLFAHVAALHTQALQGLMQLDKKYKRSYRKQLGETKTHWQNLAAHLFPNNGLQERVENFMPFYATYGPAFIQTIVDNSKPLNNGYGIIYLPNNDVTGK